MVIPTLIDMNLVELKYYKFMISLNKYTGSCNVLFSKIYVPKKTKEINVKAFNIITNKNEVKAIAKHISRDCKYKLNNTTCNSKQKWNNKTYQCECNNYLANKIIVGIVAHVFVRIVSI